MPTAALSARRKSAARSASRTRRHRRVRKRVVGTPERPRLAVFRSARHISVQLIDDLAGRTIASASTHEKSMRSATGTKTELAKQVGKAVAERAIAAGVTTVAFDRGGFKYHGRVASLADAAREGGLQF